MSSKPIGIWLASLLFCLSVGAQGQSIGSYLGVTEVQSGGNQVQVIPNATMVICAWPPSGGPPCTNPLTTYTDPSGATSCPSNAQVISPGTTTCSGTSDKAGNFEIFTTAPQNLAYYFLKGSTWEGPYVAIVGGGGSGANFASPPPLGNVAPNVVDATTLTIGPTVPPGISAILFNQQDPVGMCNNQNFDQLTDVADPATGSSSLAWDPDCIVNQKVFTVAFQPFAYVEGNLWAYDVTTGLPIVAQGAFLNPLTGALSVTSCAGCSGSGTNSYASSQNASAADSGKLVLMNCSSACSYTLPATQPSTTWNTRVMTIGSTNATIVLGGSDTFNGTTSVPVLNKWRPFFVSANTSVSTDYEGDAPLVAGTGMTLTPAANGLTLTSSGGSSFNGTVTYTSSQSASTSDNLKLVILNCTSACAYTLPATQPSTTWAAWIITVGTTNATIALGGSDTFNGSTSVPVLNQYRTMFVAANTATSTDYKGDAPLVASTNMTLTPATNGLSLSAANGGTPGGSQYDIQTNNGSGGFSAISNHSAPTGAIIAANNGAAPTANNPGLTDSPNSPVSSGGAYTFACPTSSSQADNAHTFRFQSGANTSPVVPLSSGTGCSGVVIRIVNENAGTLTFARTSPDTFSVYNGSSASTSQTSFTLTNGQYALLNQAASGIWEVWITTGGSSTTFQVNSTGLSSSSTVNFENSAATDGLTLGFSNPSAGNVQLTLAGALTNAGLANSAITIGGSSTSLGGSYAPASTVESSGCTTGTHCTTNGVTGAYWCDTSAECFFTLDAPTAGKQYCFGNYSGQTNIISITSTTSVYIVYKGANGTVTTGTLVSGGAAGDFVCMFGADTTHYMVAGAGYGSWTNN